MIIFNLKFKEKLVKIMFLKIEIHLNIKNL